MKPLSRLHAGRGPRILTLALMLAVGPAALAGLHFRVDPEYHALWMLLDRARTEALASGGPVTVRFTGWGAVGRPAGRGAGHPSSSPPWPRCATGPPRATGASCSSRVVEPLPTIFTCMAAISPCGPGPVTNVRCGCTAPAGSPRGATRTGHRTGADVVINWMEARRLGPVVGRPNG